MGVLSKKEVFLRSTGFSSVGPRKLQVWRHHKPGDGITRMQGRAKRRHWVPCARQQHPGTCGERPILWVLEESSREHYWLQPCALRQRSRMAFLSLSKAPLPRQATRSCAGERGKPRPGGNHHGQDQNVAPFQAQGIRCAALIRISWSCNFLVIFSSESILCRW